MLTLFFHASSRGLRAAKHATRRTFSQGSFSSIHVAQRKDNKHAIDISINKPEIHNAFNEVIIEELSQAFRKIDARMTRVIVLTGNGASFSAGADLNWMKRRIKLTKEESEKESHNLFEMFHAIRFCPVPTIARVNGAALGGGSGLVAACDMAFAVNSATFGFTEVRLGLIPAVISPFVLEKIGVGNASRYFLTAERFKTQEAKRIGLIQDAFEKLEELDAEIDRLVTQISNNGPEAVKKCKSLIQEVSKMDIRDSRCKLFVANEIAKISVTPEGQEGTGAFLEKRAANWQLETPKKPK